ncbi:hypothetical protein AVEN_248118-1 [Araneus ventricosus]|uniref:Uncharacterized protein n=1 Tax=Araneus ventricosus TaxID=182803 RepID=A0A4Y2UGC8_ARAVE|nr:hypothetical protein AVEN_248118-1 [Araneus ventricosus]
MDATWEHHEYLDEKPPDTSFKYFISIKMKHLILFLGVFHAVCVFWSYGYSNEEFLKQWNCISESGDEDLCKEFQDCITLVPQCYLLPYSYCMRKILPNGAGHCSKTEQAYGSEKQRLEVDECYSDITTLVSFIYFFIREKNPYN